MHALHFVLETVSACMLSEVGSYTRPNAIVGTQKWKERDPKTGYVHPLRICTRAHMHVSTLIQPHMHVYIL